MRFDNNGFDESNMNENITDENRENSLNISNNSDIESGEGTNSCYDNTSVKSYDEKSEQSSVSERSIENAADVSDVKNFTRAGHYHTEEPQNNGNILNIENYSKNEEIKDSAGHTDIDELIRKHSDNFAKAAEEIAGRDAGLDTESTGDTAESTPKAQHNTYESKEHIASGGNVNLDKRSEEPKAASNNEMPRQDIPSVPVGRSRAGKNVKKEKKKSRVGKAAGLVASAAVFGLVAGGVMFGVNHVATDYFKTEVASTESTVKIGRDNDSIKETVLVPSKSSNMDVSNIVDSAMPSVVSIYGKAEVTADTWLGRQSYEQQSSGSGIIVGKSDSELLVVTNNHVIENTDSLEVEFADGTKAAALVKGGDSGNDVAVVAVQLSDLSEDTLDKINVADIGDSENLKVGQGVVAIGNALGYGQSVTVGYISALNREIQTKDGITRNLLQTDAAINPGNSGGALLNMQGEVIGINSAKYSDTEVEGMGYAIPISTVKDLIEELSNKESRTVVEEDKQGYIGIQGKDVDSEMAEAYDMPQGIYVYKVVEGGAAASSELKAKDIITKFDGQTVQTMEDLKKMLIYYESGRTVDLTVQRLDENGDYVEKTVSITLGQRELREQ